MRMTFEEWAEDAASILSLEMERVDVVNRPTMLKAYLAVVSGLLAHEIGHAAAQTCTVNINLAHGRRAYQPPDIVPFESLAQVAKRFAEASGYSLEQLKSQSKMQPLTRVRQKIMADIYATGRFSTTQIGSFFGGRDHTTVVHAVKRAAAGFPSTRKRPRLALVAA